MKYFKTFLIVIAFSISNVLAQSESSLPKLIPFKTGNLWGYCDSTKRMTIKPQFDEPALFTTYYDWKPGSLKIAFVTKNKKHGIVDESGSFLIKCEFDILDYRYYPNNISNLIYLQKGKDAYKYTFEDKQLIKITSEEQSSTEVVEPILEEVMENYYPAGGNITITSADQRHFNITIKKYTPFTNQLIGIDSLQIIASGVKAIPKIDTLFYVRQNKKWGIISSENNTVINPGYDSIDHIWGGQVFAVQQNKKWGIIHTLKFISSPRIYQTIKNNDKSEGYLVRRNNLWGVLLEDLKTEILIAKELYEGYYIMHSDKLISVYEKGYLFKGYVDFYGTKYWE